MKNAKIKFYKCPVCGHESKKVGECHLCSIGTYGDIMFNTGNRKNKRHNSIMETKDRNYDQEYRPILKKD